MIRVVLINPLSLDHSKEYVNNLLELETLHFEVGWAIISVIYYDSYQPRLLQILRNTYGHIYDNDSINTYLCMSKIKTYRQVIFVKTWGLAGQPIGDKCSEKKFDYAHEKSSFKIYFCNIGSMRVGDRFS